MTDRLQKLSDRISGWGLLALVALATWVFVDQNRTMRDAIGNLDQSVTKLTTQVAVLSEKLSNHLEDGP